MDPRASAKHIASKAQHVTINEEGLDRCVHEILKRIEDGRLSLDLKLYKIFSVHPESNGEQDVNWVFITSALNFSFWIDEDEPQYLVTYKGKTQNGYMSMCAAMNRTMEQGVPLLDPKFYGSITYDQLNEYFMGDNNVPCPMIKERIQCLHEIARVLLEKYDGTFMTCLKKCKTSALELLNMVTDNFPCFKDQATFRDGTVVSLHKRAQILVADLWQLFEGQGLCAFHDIDQITMFADYRVPQSLLYFGALEYSSELLEFLKTNQVMQSGDNREIEIRGCSIEAVERIVAKVNSTIKINAIQVDNFLWGLRREKAEEMIKFPYHRVRSIYY